MIGTEAPCDGCIISSRHCSLFRAHWIREVQLKISLKPLLVARMKFASHFLKPQPGLTLRQLPALDLNAAKGLKRLQPIRVGNVRRPSIRYFCSLPAMTNQFQLRWIVFLLTLSGLVSSGVEAKSPSNATELYSTSGPLAITGLGEERSPETTHSQPAQGNGTSKNLYDVEGTETNGTKHHSTGNESLASTETPLQTSFPETHASSDATMVSSAPTFSASANATNSVPVAVTSSRIQTDGASTSGKPEHAETRTTQSHTPTTTVHSTRKTDPSTTKVCPTAEPKKDSLVGRCLIVIASLAAVAIVFIITTIILATKLTGSRYKHRARLLHETEMVCISALMNDCDHPLPTPKHPKSNGALIPITEDEDGDDLTLNSFLHDTEGTA